MTVTTKISVSQHAIARAIEHFRIPKTTADEWIRTNFRRATFIANIVGEDGKPARLFGYQRIAFIVANDADFILTVYPQHLASESLRTRVASIVKRELKRAERRERALERQIRIEKARVNVQIAECRLKMEMTPSRSVIRKNTEEIARLEERLAELDRQLFEVKREKTTLAKGAVMYV